jgi:hypothetical protein
MALAERDAPSPAGLGGLHLGVTPATSTTSCIGSISPRCRCRRSSARSTAVKPVRACRSATVKKPATAHLIHRNYERRQCDRRRADSTALPAAAVHNQLF